MFAPDPAEVVSANTAFSSVVQILVAVFTALVTVWVKYDQRKHSNELRDIESKLAVRDDEIKLRNAALVRFQSEHALQLYDAYIDLASAWMRYMDYAPFAHNGPPCEESYEDKSKFRDHYQQWEQWDDKMATERTRLGPAFEKFKDCFYHKRVFISEALDKRLAEAIRQFGDLHRYAERVSFDDSEKVAELFGPIADEVRHEIRMLVAPQKMTQEKQE